MEIVASKNAGVLTIELNRPDKKNSITSAMYQAMTAAVDDAESDNAVRVILFHGQPDIFCAGNDLEDFLKHPPSGPDSAVFRFMHSVSHAHKPMIAAVTGAAVGIGTTLLFHCDLVYAGDNAKFVLPFNSLGVVPEFASSYLLPMIAGYQRAAELLLLGDPFGPDKAKAAGFVTEVLPAAEALPAAQKAAARLAALPAKSVRTTKALLKHAHLQHIEAQMRVESEHFRQMLTEPAAREAFAAFFERRKPDFSKFS